MDKKGKMNGSVLEEHLQQVFSSSLDIISKIEEERKSKLVLLICYNYPLDATVSYIVNKVLRKYRDVDKLDLFLESPGGDIDSASKIAKLCLAYSKNFSVIIPFSAKSAAALIAVCANEVVMARSAELGPIDPIVRHPATEEMWIPAHSIKDALKFIEDTHDPYVKLTMADKLDPLLIGAFEDAKNAATQYVEEAFARIPSNKRNDAIEIFTERYKSHGYPIDRNLCKSVGIKIIEPESKLEDLICTLHEMYFDILLTQAEKGLIVQFSSNIHVMINDKIIPIKLEKNEKINKRK